MITLEDAKKFVKPCMCSKCNKPMEFTGWELGLEVFEDEHGMVFRVPNYDDYRGKL